MMPTGRPFSTTNRAVMRVALINSSAALAGGFGRYGLGRRRHDLLRALCKQAVAHMAAEIAVGDDALEVAVWSTTPRQPRPPVILTMASAITWSAAAMGRRSSLCMRSRT